MHREIAGLKVGYPLKWKVTGEVEARVAAIVVWTREQTDAKYLDALECERWEVVVPELVFGPAELV